MAGAQCPSHPWLSIRSFPPKVVIKVETCTRGIEFKGIGKNFAGKAALSNINLSIEKGTIHAIIGENGAGKSTLMNLLSGVHRPSAGSISIDGKTVKIENPKDAIALGIGMAHQHFMLVNVLKVWQNIILGAEPCGRTGTLSEAKIKAEIEEVCKNYGVVFNLEDVVGKLTVGEQQRIEIVKVLFRRAEYIILDEPTAVLTPEEIENMFQSVRRFKEMGKTVLFISHKLEEVLSISDRISVLRRGEHIGTLRTEEAEANQLVEMMVGREIHIDGEPLKTPKGPAVLSIRHLRTKQESFGCALKDLALQVHAGEVLGVAGVDGNGQAELVEAVMGLRRVEAGEITLNGNNMVNKSTYKIRRAGVSCIPPDRQEQGLVLDSSIARNTVLGFENLPAFYRRGFLSPNKVESCAKVLSERYDLRYNDVQDEVRELSGGNQQKVILARECELASPQLVVAVNPTRGLDIGAMEFVYEKLEDLKSAGKSILLISTELPEILRLSDRIAVLYKGEVMGVLEGESRDVQQIGRLMMGIKEAANAR